MPKIKKSKTTEKLPSQPGIWHRSLLKALLGSLLVSFLLFALFTLLSSTAATYSDVIRNNAQFFLVPTITLILFAVWFVVSSFILQKLHWQSPFIALAAMFIILIFAAYNVTSLGQTLITYPVGFVLSCCVLLIYYYWYRPTMILWIALPALLLVISAFQINQRFLANQTLHHQAVQALTNTFTYPIYFVDSIPARESMVTHFFWDPSLRNIRFVTKGNFAINEDYQEDSFKAPPTRCGITSCIDLGEIQKGQHLYTDSNNPYFVEYYVMFDKTLIRISSDKAAPLAKDEVIAYVRQFKKLSPQQLLDLFGQNYFLSDIYYFTPQQIYTPGSTGFSVIGETDFRGL